jgi:hypothetical protein
MLPYVVTEPLPPFSVNSGSAAVKLSQFVHLPSPSSSSLEDTGAESEDETAEEDVAEDAGTDSEEVTTFSEELDSTLDEEGFESEDFFSELEDLAPAESSTEELDVSELSLESVSEALADESSPQATMPAPTKAPKQKTRARFLIPLNIYYLWKKRLFGLPILNRSCLAADRFPRLAFAVLFVEILQQLGRIFRTHFTHLCRQFLRFFATIAVARIFFRLLRLGLFTSTAIAVGTVFALAAARLTVLTILLILILVLILLVLILILLIFVLILVLLILILILVLVLVLVLILILVIILILIVLLVFVLLLVLGLVNTI